jgi:hypothetical protein
MESGAMALDYHTHGAIQVWGGELLAKTGLSDAAIRDGTNFDDLKKAWFAYGRSLIDRRGSPWTEFLQRLQEGRAVILQGDYDQFTLASRCQDNFLGNHAILVLPEKSGGSWLVGDPLCSDFKFVPEYELFSYATKLSLSIFGQRSIQPLYFAITDPQADAIPAPPDTSTGEVTLKYGGYAGYRGTWEVIASGSRFRTKPNFTGTIIETVSAGYRFHNEQTTDQGSPYPYAWSSKRWLGDASGDRWIHRNLCKLV